MSLTHKQKKGIRLYLLIFLLNLFVLIFYFCFSQKIELVNYIRDISTIILLYSFVRILGYLISNHYDHHHIKRIPYNDHSKLYENIKKYE